MGVGCGYYCVAELTIARAIGCAALKDAGCGCVAKGAGVFVDINDEAGFGVTAGGAAWGLGERVMRGWQVIFVVSSS